MVSRRVWLAGLGTALVGPYLAFETKLPALVQGTGGQGWFNGSSSDAASHDFWLDGQISEPQFDTPNVRLEEALSYEVTPQWVVSRWPRVATVVSELEWSGMRVPLITGNQPADVVGSLSYYFDGSQQLRRISLEGYCGDESALVAIATQRFGLQAEPSITGGLYVYRWSRQAMSVLSVHYTSIVQEQSLHRRHVAIELNHPLAGWRLSPQMQALVGS
jgi:hypothetical protein